MVAHCPSTSIVRRLLLVVLLAITSLCHGNLLATTAIWEGGSGEWGTPSNWNIDGISGTIVPGSTARPTWEVVIDGNPVEASFVTLGPAVPGPVTRHIDALQITADDTLRIEDAVLTTRTGVEGSTLTNQGNLVIAGNGSLNVQGSDMRSPDDGVLTLTGGGNVILEGEPGTTPLEPGARIGGEGPEPRTLINTNNRISGTGSLGVRELAITNLSTITADRDGKRLIIDPGGELLGAGDFRNLDTGVLSATSGGLLELRRGTFLNGPQARIVAENNSIVELGFSANVMGGSLASSGSGRIRVVGDAALTTVSLSGYLEVQDDSTLVIGGAINNSGTIEIGARSNQTKLEIEGPAGLSGSGTLVLNSSLPQTALAVVVPKNPPLAQLTNGSSHTISGSGAIGPERLRIYNHGTISADQDQHTLSIGPSAIRNSGVLEARNGGTLRLERDTSVLGDGGIIRANFEDMFGTGPSLVLLDGPEISSQRLQTPGNPSAAMTREEIDTSKGVIRTHGNRTQFKLGLGTVINEGLLEIVSESRLTLTSGILENTGTIVLNADPDGMAEILVSAGDVQLTGGGRIVLSNANENRIEQADSALGITYTLSNVDNTIEGGGQLGMDRLNFHNLTDGVIRNTVSSPLVIDPPEAVSRPFRVLTRNEGLIEASGAGSIVLRPGSYQNGPHGRILADAGGSVAFMQGSLQNGGTVEARGQLARLSLTGTSIGNPGGTLAATSGGVMEIRGATVVGSGMIVAGDESRIEVSDDTLIQGGEMTTSGTGMIRVMNRASITGSAENKGHIEIPNGATLAFVGADFVNSGTVTLDGDDRFSTLQIVDTTEIRGTGSIVLSDSSSNLIAGNVREGGIVFASTTIRGAGEISAPIAVQQSGRVIADGTNPLVIRNLPINYGLVRAEGTGGIQISNPLLENHGTLQVGSGSQVEAERVVNRGAGSAIVRIESSGHMAADEIINTSSHVSGRLTRADLVIDGTLAGFLRNDGRLSGSGLLNGKLLSEGKFSPGDSPGVFSIDGQFEQLVSGELEIEIAGIEAGEDHDQVVISSEAVLDGTVVVKHLNGFAAEAGAEFDVVSAATLVDNSFSLALLDGGLVQPAILEMGNGTMALRLTSIEGLRYSPVSGSWDTAANWTGATVPGAADTAFLRGDPLADTFVAGPAADTSVYALVVGSGDAASASSTTLDLRSGVITTSRGTTVRSDGRLAGSGTLGGDLYNVGTVSSGGSAGMIRLVGDYNQNEGGTLVVELGGTIPSETFDQLIVDGTATLDGRLEVSLIDLGAGIFEPAAGDHFRILTADTAVAGGFSAIEFPPLAGEFTWELDYLPNSVVLRTALIGDYNNNGRVEQADLDLVLLGWGVDASDLPPEWINQRPTEGTIDQAELDVVLLNWGKPIRSLAAATGASVPEPSTAFLMLVAAIGLLLHLVLGVGGARSRWPAGGVCSPSSPQAMSEGARFSGRDFLPHRQACTCGQTQINGTVLMTKHAVSAVHPVISIPK